MDCKDNPKIIPMPSPPEPAEDEPVTSAFTVSMGGRKLRLDFSAMVEDITDEPSAEVLPMPPKPR